MSQQQPIQQYEFTWFRFISSWKETERWLERGSNTVREKVPRTYVRVQDTEV